MPLTEKAWEPALKRARPALKFLARQRLPHQLWRKVDPSDVVQITLQEAYEKRRKFRGNSEEQLLAWLHPMLLHRLLDELRRYKAKKQDARLEVPLMKLVQQTAVRLRTELTATGASPSQPLMMREMIDRMGRALEALPANQRLVVELHHLKGLSSSEIASVLKRNPSAVAALLQRGLENLREALKGEI